MNQNRTIANPIVGDKVTFIKTAEETNGQQTVVEVELMPNAKGTPAHYHSTFSETFTVVNGELGLQINSKKMVLKKDETAIIKPNILHRFFNPTNKFIKFQVTLSPASPQFEQGLRIAYGLACDGECNKQGIPKRLSYLALLFDMGESRLPGIMGLLTPLLKRLATRARKKGVDKQLIARYC